MHALRRHALILLFYTVLALIMTYPLITQLGTHYAGNNEDLWTFQWDNWWTRYALQHGYDILFTPMQFYPVGVSLAAHSLSFYNSFLWIPLAALFGDLAAYNLTVLLTFILSGYTMYLLAEYVITDRRRPLADAGAATAARRRSAVVSSLIAGLVFAFAPYHFSQSLGHVSLASVQWFPLLALFALKAVREARWRNAVAIGLLIGLITATRLQFLVLGGAVFAVFVAVDWSVARRDWVRGALGRLLVASALGLVLSLPIILPAARLFTQAASPDELIADEQTWGQTDLAAYFVPMTYHPLIGPAVKPIYENFIKNQAWMPFLGYSVMALSIWGALKAKRRAAPWLVMGGFLFIMALGPFLRVNGVSYENIPLPYALIGDKFPLNTLRSPDRYNLLLPLALAVLVAFGVDAVLQRTTHRRAASFIGVLIGALILFEYLGVPYPTIAPLPSPPFLTQIANDPEPYAVLDIPLDRSDTKRYLYYQTIHERPIVQGRVARVPEAAFKLFNEIPLLAAWYRSLGAPRVPDLGAQLQALADYQVRYIIFHKDLSPPAFVTTLRNYFTLPPIYEDDQIAVYSTRPVIPAPAAASGGLGIVASWAGVEGPDKPVRVRIRWVADRPIGRDYAFRLALIDDTGASVVESIQPFSPPTSKWLPGALVVGDYELTPLTPIPIGRYTLKVEVLDDGRSLGAINLPHRLINEPAVDNGRWLMVVSDEPRAVFGSSIELRAADVSRRGNVLNLWLHWRALAAPGADAKYFVHLLAADGRVAAQVDAIHGNYTNPSSGWRADQLASDLIELPLWKLPPGQYRIAVGLTDPDTGDRWPAVDSADTALPDNRYIFDESITIQ